MRVWATAGVRISPPRRPRWTYRLYTLHRPLQALYAQMLIVIRNGYIHYLELAARENRRLQQGRGRKGLEEAS